MEQSFCKNRKFDDQAIMKNFENYDFLQSDFLNNPFYSKFYGNGTRTK